MRKNNISSHSSGTKISLKSWVSWEFLVAIWIGVQIVLTVTVGAYTVPGDLTLTVTHGGRVTDLTVGGQDIFFCGNGQELTGGFYVRENTIPDGAKIPNGCTNLITGDPDPSVFAPGTIGLSGQYWAPFKTSDSTTIEVRDLTIPDNDVAVIEIDESEYQTQTERGHYGGIYRDLELPEEQVPFVHELFFFSFEVKTRCGWRSKLHPLGFNEGGLDKFGYHNVSGWIEWHEWDPADVITRKPDKPHLESFISWVRFDALGTSQNMTADELTRFCGRSYRPKDAQYARIVLIVDGHMPRDGNPADPAEDSEVYFDNICFYKAPDLVQAQGKAGPHALFSGRTVDLVEHMTLPQVELDLEMTARIMPCSDYLLVQGKLGNKTTSERAIDLGFAIPILDENSNQELEWHYDMRNSIYVGQAEDLIKSSPFTFPGPVDLRPRCSSSVEIPGSHYQQLHNLQVSAYPISSLGIHKNDAVYGLSFGDALENELFEFDACHPGISRFGYQILQPGSEFVGYYFVEFNIGLLADSVESDDETEFSFIIFRSDDPDYEEKSNFREGMQKYQREIYPEGFHRPTNTPDQDWLLGGGFYPLDPGDNDGCDDNPNAFGFRYTQTSGDDGGIEPFIYVAFARGVGVLSYDRPWEGTFENHHDPEFRQNTYEGIGSEKDATYYSGGGLLGAIYRAKNARIFKIPPGDQELLADSPEGNTDPDELGFPTLLADSPTAYPGDSLQDYERRLLERVYEEHQYHSECFAGIELDNTFNARGKSNHLDVCGNRRSSFVENGGRLTYSFNHFLPAIPQLCSNVWILPHFRDVLTTIDETYPYGDHAPTNIEDEVISINALEPQFGGLKYGIINADVIGFESNASTRFNRSDHAFNFRRALARDKTVARKLLPVPCLAEVVATLWPGEPGAPHFWKYDYNLFKQILHESAWIALEWGFHPSFTGLFSGLFAEDQDLDDLVDTHFRQAFVPGIYPDVGYTEIYRQLHFAGWQPVTNVVNTSIADGQAPGDPGLLFVERFGPTEEATLDRPVYVTILNNDDLTLTLNDVVDVESLCRQYIGDMETEQEVEDSDICSEKYAMLREYDESKYGPLMAQASDRTKYFQLDLSDPDRFGLDNYNLHGAQLVNHASDNNAVNSPEIIAREFDPFGNLYSVKLCGAGERFVRIAGKRNLLVQDYGVIPDKALMVFKIWVDNKVDNGDGGDGREAGGRAYYERYGSWTSHAAETAHRSSFDAISSTDLSASALFRMDIGRSGCYDIRVSYPEVDRGTTSARYDVFLIERSFDEEGDTETVNTDPVLTTFVDQSARSETAIDEEGFISIGEIDVHLSANVDQVTVVVRLSSGGEETYQGAETYVLADAVKFEQVDP